MKKRLKLIAYVLGGMALLIGILWIMAAFRAGNFHTDRDVFVSSPGEPSMEEFSKRKKYIKVDLWNVADIDEGKGERSFCFTVARFMPTNGMKSFHFSLPAIA